MKAVRHFPSLKWRAFTLLEVMVSSSLAMIVLVTLTTTVLNLSQQGRRLSDHIDRGARVRLVMDLLSNDLRSMIVKQDSNNWLAIDILGDAGNSGTWLDGMGQKPKDDSLVLDPRSKPDQNGTEWAEPEDYRFGVGGMWLRFITSAADRSVFTDGKAVPGDINAVSYQLVRRAMPGSSTVQDAANASYQLFRTIVRSDHTFEQGYKVQEYAGSSQPGEAGEMKTPSVDSLLCDNIIDLGVIVYEINAAGEYVQAFPMRHKSLPKLLNEKQYRVPQDGVPTSFEALIRVLSASGARELRGREVSELASEEWWSIAKRHSRVYSRSFSVPRAF